MPRTTKIDPKDRSKQLRYYHRKRDRAQEAARIQEKRSDTYLWLKNNLKYKRYQAKKLGLAFDLDEEWLKSQPMMCAISGKSFTVGGPCTPSFDQKLAGKGYTRENTQLICLWLNMAKRDWPEDQIRALIVETAEVFDGHSTVSTRLGRS